MMMNQTTWWASESFWRKTAIFVTAGMFLVLVVLTFDTLTAISTGSARVPAYTVITSESDSSLMPSAATRYRSSADLLRCSASRSTLPRQKPWWSTAS